MYFIQCGGCAKESLWSGGAAADTSVSLDIPALIVVTLPRFVMRPSRLNQTRKVPFGVVE